MDKRTYMILLGLVVCFTMAAGLTKPEFNTRQNKLFNAISDQDKPEEMRIGWFEKQLKDLTTEADRQVRRELLDSTKGGDSLFSAAIKRDDLTMVKLTVKYGANFQMKQSLSGFRGTPLEYAHYYKQQCTQRDTCKSYIDSIISYLTTQENACSQLDGCGANSESGCYMDNDQMNQVCICEENYVKDPSTGLCHDCVKDGNCPNHQACREHTCKRVCPSDCVEDATCTTPVYHRATCTCKVSLPHGNPAARHDDSGCHECTEHSHCAKEKHCKGNRCEDPCETCFNSAANATCTVMTHQPTCTCPQGYMLKGITVTCEDIANSVGNVVSSWKFYSVLATSSVLAIIVVGLCIIIFIIHKRLLIAQSGLIRPAPRPESDPVYVEFEETTNPPAAAARTTRPVSEHPYAEVDHYTDTPAYEQPRAFQNTRF